MPLRALSWPLSPEAVRDAYFFGQGSDRIRVAEFLGQYLRVYGSEEQHLFHGQDGDSLVGRIELRTPYQMVVRKSWENTVNYSEQQAQIDIAPHADVVEISVLFFFGDRQPAPSDLYLDKDGRVLDHREGFWQKYRFRVTQGHEIVPRRIVGTPIYGRRGQGLSGAEVRLQFDAGTFLGEQVRIEVVAPDGQTTAAEFPLDKLK